jgi:hypothetical protein
MVKLPPCNELNMENLAKIKELEDKIAQYSFGFE